MPNVRFSAFFALFIPPAITSRHAMRSAARRLCSAHSQVRRCSPSALLLRAVACAAMTLPLASAARAQAPVLSTFHCGYDSVYGSLLDPCEVTLTAPAGSGGLKVQLSSNNAAAVFPTTTVTVAAGSSTLWFHATVAVVSTKQTATLSATEGGVTKTFAVTLNAAPQAMSVVSIVNFGDVTVNSTATQSLTLTSSGEDALTVSSATVTGTRFTLASSPLPVTLKPNQSATLELEFDPAKAGAHRGTLTITSNSSAGSATVVSLIGTGEPAVYQVSLSWSAPENPPVQISGYRVFRAAGGSSGYALLNSSLDAETSFTDDTVEPGTAYDYYVESVDIATVPSSPSSVIAVSVP